MSDGPAFPPDANNPLCATEDFQAIKGFLYAARCRLLDAAGRDSVRFAIAGEWACRARPATR